MTDQIGVAHGRFQPLHLGHMEYLLAAHAACQVLLVGITNPDPWQTVFEPTDPARGEALANPCSFYERLLMVEEALVGSHVSRSRFRIVPFPHGHPERLLHYVPAGAPMLVTIYDRWGESKLDRFQRVGLPVRVLWRRTQKMTSGTAIREAICTDRPWEHLVPKATARVIRQFGITERIKRLAAEQRASALQ